MVQKLSELGAAALEPVAFRRSVARWSPSKAHRMERIAAEAAKQCGRDRLMELRPERKVEDLAREGGTTFVADPEGETTLLRAALGATGEIRVVIGPEGGLTPEEREALGGVRVSLGSGILRIETAAVAAAAVLAQV